VPVEVIGSGKISNEIKLGEKEVVVFSLFQTILEGSTSVRTRVGCHYFLTLVLNHWSSHLFTAKVQFLLQDNNNNNEWHYSPDGRKPPLMRSCSLS
jgi:hypothetical protein